jgi:hypothetical protein
MTSERIKEIQQQTSYPNSVSVQQALLQVWNECSQLPQQEISDEKIGESARDYWRKGQLGIEKYADTERAWINACKWYREQLKTKN